MHILLSPELASAVQKMGSSSPLLFCPHSSPYEPTSVISPQRLNNQPLNSNYQCSYLPLIQSYMVVLLEKACIGEGTG